MHIFRLSFFCFYHNYVSNKSSSQRALIYKRGYRRTSQCLLTALFIICDCRGFFFFFVSLFFCPRCPFCVFGYNFWTMRPRALIFHTCIPCNNPLLVTYFFNLVTLTLMFDLLFWTWFFFQMRPRALIFHTCISCNKPFLMTYFFQPCDLDLDVWPTFL